MKPWLTVLVCAAAAGYAAAKPLEPEDFADLRKVSEPQVSPDGRWVAYVVETTDRDKDEFSPNLWRVGWDGSGDRALTFGSAKVSHPRWSPDGKWIAFLSSREDDNENDQLWLLPTDAGEAKKVTDAPEGVDDFAWAPDSRRLVLVEKDLDPREKAAREADKDKKTVPPLVITRYYFKEDITGYLTGEYSHLHLLDIGTKKDVRITAGDHDELLPAWSPDGQRIAYVTKRGEDPDRTDSWNVYVIEAKPGAAERALTQTAEANSAPDWESPPAWSPDGRSIVFLHGGPPKQIEYASYGAAVVDADGGPLRMLDPALDRNVTYPTWTPDGQSVLALVEEDRTQTLQRFPARGGRPSLVAGAGSTATEFSIGGSGHTAVLVSTPDRPFEVYAVEKGALRRLTHQSDAWVSRFPPARTELTQFRSRDGTEVHGFVVLPGGAAKPAPAGLLRPHGGPQSQYDTRYSFEAQLFAAHGYTVILPNPRGSTGRGTGYGMGIYAAWGSVDVQDDLAAVDDAVARGLADPNRLGVGGWSYGGMSTDYLIASTHRFKAATSGASIANILAGFGTDEYVRDYIQELGAPWEHPDTWMRVSYAFYHADRIQTPTLFLVGQSDFNVPALNSEQLYQALRQLRVPTELVEYPGQFHHFLKPSYEIDVYRRYLEWYRKWIPETLPRP